jgi:uncharacterized protein involved in exopolysaccharide biosynthesis
MISSNTYTINDYLAAFRRRRSVFVFTAVPVIAVAAAIAMLLPDEYRSYSRIDIDLEGANVKTLEPIELTTYADQYIAKLQERVISRDKLLALANDPEVFGPDDGELSESERIDMIREGLGVRMITQPVRSPTSGREVDLISGFEVTSTGSDPEFAFHVAKYVATEFLKEDRLSRTERASSTSSFLREQMRKIELEIVDLEKEIANFKVKHACCLPELMAFNMSVIQRAERDIESLQPRIRALEQDRIFLQARLDELRAQSVSTDRLSELEVEYLRLVANYGPDYPDLARVRREISAITSVGSGDNDTFDLVELRVKLAEAEQKYSDEHPDVIRYKREIAALEAKQAVSGGSDQTKLLDNPRYQQLRGELNAIDTELIELRMRNPELRQKIEEYENRLTRTPQIESEYQALNRKFETARDNFQNLQQRLVIARQTEALESTEIGARLAEIRPAIVPQAPSGPPRVAILIIGVFLAGTLGIGLMLISDIVDMSIRGSRDIATVMDMVPLATIPVVQNSVSQTVKHRHWLLVSGTALVVAITVILIYAGSFN